MAEGQSPLVDRCSGARSAELLGAVSPGLCDHCAEAIPAQTIRLADAGWAEDQAALKASRNAAMDPAINPLLVRALRTEKTANLLGVNLGRVVPRMLRFLRLGPG